MTLERSLRASVLTLVGTAIASVTLALGSLAWFAVGLGGFVGCLVLSGLRPGWHLRGGMATVAVVLIAQGFLAEIVGTATLLVPAAHFLLLTQLVWLARERTSRHYGWLLLTSMVQMVVSGVLSVDILFGLSLAVYLPAGVLSIVLLNLRCELERNGPASPAALGEVSIRPRLFASVALVGFMELALTVVIFLYFPRFGIQIFQLRPVRKGPALTGFSDEVRFGDLARILENPDVVMSARLLQENRPIRGTEFPLRWRGIALDTYEDATWSTRNYIRDASIHPLRLRTFRPAVRAAPGPFIVQEIALEPVNSRVLFHLPRLFDFRSATPNLEEVEHHEETGTISSVRSNAVSLRYIVRSRIPLWPIEQLRQPRTFASKEAYTRFQDRFRRRFGHCLQLPPSITGRVAELAEQICRGIPPDAFYDRAKIIETYLRARYDYTLRAGRPRRGVDPVEDFLFRTKRGHCEHFAAAMVLLLRSTGIPARMVTGFQGGEWNEYGQFYAIRQLDAHAWVEARIPSVDDWCSFDPTPPSEDTRDYGYGLMARLGRRFAYLRLTWNAYVVNYSSQDQKRLADAATRLLARLSNAIPALWGRDWFAVDSGYSTGIGALILTWAGILALAAGVFFVLRLARRVLARGRRLRRSRRPAVSFYRKLEAILRRHGFRREPAVTPLEFVRDVVARGGERYEPAATVAEAFCKVRYGARRLSSPERAEVVRALAALEGRQR